MVVFLVLSFGLYYMIWFFRRRAGLNRLDSPTKLPMWPLLSSAAFFVVQFVVGMLEGFEPGRVVIGEASRGVLALVQLVVGVVMLIQCFRIKDIIQDHATPPPDFEQRFVAPVQLSGLMTFFFSIFYLQWAINKHVVGRPTR